MIDLSRRGELYLGKTFDLATQQLGDIVQAQTRDLTTHAVILGMTGSGKTGLGVGLIEEALLDGLPVIVIDPKGDIANLALTFPDARAEDFASWVSKDEAFEKGIDVQALAEQTAQRWQQGWAEWNITPERVRELKERSAITIYTPGSTAGVPVDILQAVEAPGLDWEGHEEELRTRISGVVSALLAMVGVEADPVQSREHILLSHLFERAWRSGEPFDVPALIRAIQYPPLQQVGVFEIEAFFPQKDRFGLAASLNNLIAAPGFETWRSGQPLDIDALLRTDDGRPRASIFYLAHLDDDQRMFFVTMLLGQIMAWLRRQSGTSTLRAILYFDEIFGYCPPHPKNPPTKALLLGLIKQARAMGLGITLATQNPVDLDYKGLANIGTWFIGRMRTERDKARVLDGLESVASESGSGLERDELERALGKLPSRVFVMHNVHAPHPIAIQSRWAMSFLRGPVTKQEIKDLQFDSGDWRSEIGQGRVAESTSSFSILHSQFSANPPTLSPDVSQFFLPPAITIEWALRQWEQNENAQLVVEEKQLVYEPHWLGMGTVHVVDRARNIDHVQTITAVHPARNGDMRLDWSAAQTIHVDRATLQTRPVKEAVFDILAGDAGRPQTLKKYQKDFADYLYRNVTVAVPYHALLKISGQPGDSPREFRARIEDVARAKRDEEIEKVRKSYAREAKRIEDRQAREQRELARDEERLNATKREENWALAETVFNFIRGRRQSYGVAWAMRRRGNTNRAKQEVEESYDTLHNLQDVLDELRESLTEEIELVAQKWVDVLSQVEEMQLKPRRSDVHVDEFGLIWMPRWHITGNMNEQKRQIELGAYGPS